ncbi:hypothetical protein B0J14DRAFT_622106 [Halenospora varia]|nr:hypothetical protein B0J14DRAFT_622106 [Halenospora varia]
MSEEAAHPTHLDDVLKKHPSAPYPDIYYEPGKSSHGLLYDPFKSIVIPRPNGWIGTTSVDGQDNLAPFSQFTNVAFDSPTILFIGHGSYYKNQRKDSVANARETGEFLREKMNESAMETGEDEFPLAKVTKSPSRIVRPTRVAESPIHYECKTWSVIQAPGNSCIGCSDIVIGRVVAVHIKGEVITGNGLIDVLKARLLARLGYHQYTSIESVFEMVVPLMPDDTIGAAVLGGDKAKVSEEMAKRKKTWFGTVFKGA